MQQVAPEKRQRLSSGQQVPQGGQGPNAGRGGQVVGPQQVRRIQQPSTPQQRQNGQKVPISQRYFNYPNKFLNFQESGEYGGKESGQ